ncbi:MAG: UDP-N-acetylmuramate dehydrogenase [Lachnospiraceae bacterium]|nr:UDP-N-acetylmuramate dehydrogenase [Lachnospiraceae bacterium]
MTPSVPFAERQNIMMDWKKAFSEKFSAHLQILWQEPLSKHTTFKIGGAAECFVCVSNEGDIPKILDFCRTYQVDLHLMGNGSNLLVDDQGVPGVVMCMGEPFSAIRVEGNRITAQAGALMSKISRCACDEALSGLEFAQGIPGSIGGGVIMNAGAYGGEMSQVVVCVEAYDREGKLLRLSGEELGFAYRTSAMKERELIVASVTMELVPGDRAQIKFHMAEYAKRRREKQPLEYPSAGSTFKRPAGYYAGKLIQDAGFSGYQVGDACVSEKHCGFVINRGNATCAQVRLLMQKVIAGVEKAFGVTLEPEVIYWGQTDG